MIRTPAPPAYLQIARLWAARFRVMGLDCRCVPIGQVTPHERRREPDLWLTALCCSGIAPGLIHFIATM